MGSGKGPRRRRLGRDEGTRVAKPLRMWIEDEVKPVRGESLTWLSHHWFFRDPPRPSFSDLGFFFSPADGVLLYQEEVEPDEPILDLKGATYSLRQAMRNPRYDKRSLVVGVFMTFYDVHVNRLPYPGRLSYRLLDPIDTHNRPMLDLENGILEDLRLPEREPAYLHSNQRVLNRVYAPALDLEYFVLQIADYDVDAITPFELRQNQLCEQGERFSQIRFGSQVDLIIPCSDAHELVPVQETGCHVEAGLDPLVAVRPMRQEGRESLISQNGNPPRMGQGGDT